MAKTYDQKTGKFVELSVSQERDQLMCALVRWFQRSTKATISQARRLYELSDLEVLELRRRLCSGKDRAYWRVRTVG